MTKLVELIAKEDYITAKPILEKMAGKKLVEIIDKKKNDYINSVKTARKG